MEWNLESLGRLSAKALGDLCLRTAGCLVKARLLFGRILVAMDQTHGYEEFGCCSSVHFAKVHAGIDKAQALECRLVASRLVDFPLLSRAAERAEIRWSALREILRKVTPETEEYWLEMASECNQRQLELHLRRAEPNNPGSTQTSELLELRAMLPAETHACISRAMRHLSRAAARMLGMAEVLEHVFAEFCSGLPAEEVLEEDAPAPWEAVAAEESECPGNAEIRLLQPAQPHWANPRVRYNPETRLATPAQRQELLRRDGFRCSTPGCTNFLWLHVHHLVFYCDEGTTVPEGLVVVCSACHRNIHRGSLQVRGQAPDALTWTDRENRDLQRVERYPSENWLQHWLGAA